jgi:hypothetical protein
MSSIQYFAEVHRTVVATNLKLDLIQANVATMGHNLQRRAELVQPATPASSQTATTPATPRRRVQVPLLFTSPLGSDGGGTVNSGEITTTSSSIPLSTLLFMWYSVPMYVDDGSLKLADRDLRVKMAKAVCYCKRFLPNGTVLAPRPTSTSAAESAWVSGLRKYGADAERLIMDFVSVNTASVGGMGKKKKKANFIGVLVHLRKISYAVFPAEPAIVDQAVEEARLAGYKCFHYGSISEFIP